MEKLARFQRCGLCLTSRDYSEERLSCREVVSVRIGRGKVFWWASKSYMLALRIHMCSMLRVK